MTTMLEAIGNTPLVRLRRVVPEQSDSGMKYLAGDLYGAEPPSDL